MVVSSNSFLSKVLDDPTDWATRPYSLLKGGLPPLFTSLKSVPTSLYRDIPWSDELYFIGCAFPSHLQAHFHEDYETQAYNPHRFARQFGFDQGVLGHLSTLALPTVVASLGFKKEKLIKILVSGSEIPFPFHPKLDYLHPGLSHGGLVLGNMLGILEKVRPNE